MYVESFVTYGFTQMNPLQKNFLEPQRYILDRNLQNDWRRLTPCSRRRTRNTGISSTAFSI
jgi:hypothetical protein